MNQNELKEFFMTTFKEEKIASCYQTVRNRYKRENDYLYELTAFLSEKASFNERLFCILNDITEQPLCKNPSCNKPVKFNGWGFGYNAYCCSRCGVKDPSTQEKKKQTNIERYGHIAPIGNVEIRKKIEATTEERFGDKNISRTRHGKEKKIEKAREKYGVDHVFQATEVKEKTTQTIVEKFGVDNPMKSDVIKTKTKNTNIDKYGNSCCLLNDDVKQKTKNTLLKKFGVDHASKSDEVKEKIRQTNLEKFGFEHAAQNPEKKEKTKQTFVEHYGVDNPMKTDECKNKSIETCRDRFGVDYALQSQDVKEKIKETNLEKYGVEYPCQNEQIKNKLVAKLRQESYEKIKNQLSGLNVVLLDEQYTNAFTIHKFKCLVCGTEFRKTWCSVRPGESCPVCFPKTVGKSRGETELFEFIKDLKIYVKSGDKTLISPYELDIYIPEKKIAIEYDGLYWHSVKINPDEKYHLMKTCLCEERGVQLIHVFEDEWEFKKDIVKNRLKQILGCSVVKRVHARKCVIKEISSESKNEFLEKYHIQGKDASAVRLGAFYENVLLAVMTFSKGNIAKGSKAENDVWELNRFCSNSDYHIPGIAGKLLEYFKTYYRWKEIFSYADRRWSHGSLYEKLNFEFSHDTKPNYWYSDGTTRIHRFNLRKQPNEPKDISEHVLREQQGFLRIYDCGSKKYVMKNQNYDQSIDILTF